MDLISRRALLGAGASLGLGVAQGKAAPAPLRLRRGVNAFPWFALTQEYPAPSRDYAWPPFQPDRPVPTPRDLATLSGAGFDFLRLPVDPGPFLAAPRGRREALLDSLDAAIQASLGAGLSVVVNLQGNAATHYWTPERMTGAPDAPEFAAYLALVAEVAARLAKAPAARVALEPINEPGGACGARATAEVRRRLLETARASAPALTLVASGGCGSLIQGLPDFDFAALASLGPILATFHFYEPYLFTHQGAPWMQERIYRSLGGVPWPASEGDLETTLATVRRKMAADPETPAHEKALAYADTQKALKVYFDAAPARPFIANYLRLAAAWADAQGLPREHLLMGEFGALRTDRRYSGAAAPDRARYVKDVRETAEALGFPWAFWCLFDGMGVMDEETRRLDPALVAALGLRA